MKKLFFVLLVLATTSLFAQTTIQTQLFVSTNAGTTGGSFKIDVQAKGTNLTGNNTIGSGTLDIYFAPAVTPVILGGTVVSVTYNAGLTGTAYARSVNYVASGPYVRFSLSSAAMDGTVPGFALTSSYQTLATISFTILNSALSTTDTVSRGSLTIGLYNSPDNNNFSGTINAQTMSAPVNIVNVALPVELVSLTAAAQGANSAILRWSTATEINNNGFDVERRAEGTMAWAKIGFIAGAGTSNSPKEYSYQDVNVAPGVNVYRLKQIDNGGSFKYSASVEVDAGTAVRRLELLNNYPNPFNPATEIRFSVPEDGYASLKVYNVLGQEVATLFSGMARAGHYIPATFNAGTLASGVYLSRLEYNGKSMIQRMLLTK
jgi:hypothetical protein